MKIILALVDWFSGEWLLHGRPNGGSVVFLRSLLVSGYIFAFAIFIKCAIDPDTLLKFSLHELRVEIRDSLPWLGAIFAATYTGFYTRYASQWNYIAGLYNQIMATASTRTTSSARNEAFLFWQAAFIEDCYHLHLDRKEIFAFAIKQLLSDPAVLKTFIECTPEDISQRVLERCDLVPAAA